MPGPQRDLAVADPWNASLVRSRARRARSATKGARARPRRVQSSPAAGPLIASATAREVRDLAARAVAEANSGPAAGELCTRRGRARAPFVAERARRARERTSEAFQGSATARSRWGPGMDSRPFSFALRLRG